MCGLVAILSNNSVGYNDRKRVFQDILYMSALRGLDGTGIAAVWSPTKQAEVFKRALASYDFITLRNSSRILNNIDKAKVMLGHTRSATKATCIDENAHPFQHNHITLIHNGHVSNYRQFLETSDRIEVDSDAIALALSRTKDPIDVLSKLIGAYCLIWHNAEDGTFNIARNDERPLVFAYVPAWRGAVFASELGMLAAALERANVKIDDHKFLTPAKHVLYQWDITSDLKEPSEYTTRPFQQAHYQPRSPHTGGGTPGRTYTETGTNSRQFVNGATYESLFKARDLLTRLSKKGTNTSHKKLAKAQARVESANLLVERSYACTPKAYFPYLGDQVNGYALFDIEGALNRGKKCVVQNVTRAQFQKLKAESMDGHAIFIKMADSIGLPDGAYVLIGNLARVSDIDRAQGDLASQVILDAPPMDTSPDDNDDAAAAVLLLPGPGGVLVPEDAWCELTKDGCCRCTGTINPVYMKDVKWEGEFGNQPVCHECASEDSVKRLI